MAEVLKSVENLTETAGEWLNNIGSKIVDLLPPIISVATLIGVVRNLFEGKPTEALKTGFVGVVSAAGIKALS